MNRDEAISHIATLTANVPLEEVYDSLKEAQTMLEWIHDSIHNRIQIREEDKPVYDTIDEIVQYTASAVLIVAGNTKDVMDMLERCNAYLKSVDGGNVNTFLDDGKILRS